MSEENKKQPLPDEKLEKVAGGAGYKGWECLFVTIDKFAEYYDKGINNGCPNYSYNGHGWIGDQYYGEDMHHCRQCWGITDNYL